MHRTMGLLKVFSVIGSLAMVFSSIQPAPARAQSGDGLRREINAESGKVSFLGSEMGKPLSASQTFGLFARPADPAMALAERFAPEFGLKDPTGNLAELTKEQGEDGRLTVKYQQEYQGIPVMGGELIVNTNDQGDLYSMNGEVSPEIGLEIRPVIDAVQAGETALQAVAKWYQSSPEDLEISEPELWIFDESLLQPSTRPVELVWRMEVTPKDPGMPVRELVLVNAERGSISLHFNQIDTAWTASRQTDEVTSFSGPVQASQTSGPGGLHRDEASTGTTWFVSTTGSDLNSCAGVEAPCATITAALNRAATNDTLKVTEGIFGAITVSKSILLSGGWDPTFSYQSGRSTIDGQNTRVGILLNGNSTVLIENVVVQNGKSPIGEGGGIYVTGSTLTLNNSILQDNTSMGGNGGGIFTKPYSSVIVNSSAINGNVGTGIYSYGSMITVTLNNSTVSINSGGIYYSSDGELTLNNSTVSSNHSSGGLMIRDGSATLNNSTVNNNSSTGGGGGIARTGGTVTLRNTIVSGNASIYSSPDCLGGINSAGYNLIGNTSGCTFVSSTGDLLNVDPRLGDLLGLPGYHALAVDSPAIDAGNPAVPGSIDSACLLYDQRGTLRPVGSSCDIGAYEYRAPESVVRLAILQGNDQHVILEQELRVPLKVAAVDRHGIPVPNVGVSFTAPDSGASGTFTDSGGPITTVMTSSTGVATAPALTANSVLGMYTITASASGVDPVYFSLENFGTTWFVATNGSDVNTCQTPAAPCLTINGAVGKASPGDTIKVAQGRYTGTGSFVVTIGDQKTLSGGWDSTFNTQNGLSFIDGQGVRSGISSLGSTVDHFVVTNGFSQYDAGGISASGPLFVLNNSVITNNRAGRGGISSTASFVTLNNSTIRQNTSLGAQYGGGITIMSGQEVNVNNSTIAENQAPQAGGGMKVDAPAYQQRRISFNNSTIANNQAMYGGGIYAAEGSSYLSVALSNSIVANNLAIGLGSDCFGAINTLHHSLIGSNRDCILPQDPHSLVNVNPLLSTHPLGAPGYYALHPESPAINKGEDCLAADQRGMARPEGIACDMGAYEYTPPLLATTLEVVSGTGQRMGPLSRSPEPLIASVTDAAGSPVPGVAVTFAAPSQGASGIFADRGTPITTVLTNAVGLAVSPAFTANLELGTYAVAASSPSLAGSVRYTLTNAAWFVSPTGNDANTCSSPDSPCRTINAAIDKAQENDLIKVAAAVYAGSTSPVVSITKSVTLSGGWNVSFTTQDGMATLDGAGTQLGVNVESPNGPQLIVSMERFNIQNGRYGIFNYETLTLRESNVLNNHTGDYYQDGAGIRNYGTMIVENCTVSGNVASGGGGGIYNTGSLVLENSTISGNTAALHGGGGIYNYYNGFTSSSVISIHNSTIVDNLSAHPYIRQAGGIRNNGTVSIANSILDNVASSGEMECSGNDLISRGYNLVRDGWDCPIVPAYGDQIGSSDAPVDPRLSPLQNNGGFTLTHALQANSPALNGGNPAAPGSGENACAETDQRKVSRPVDRRCDIGSFEGSLSWSPAPLVRTYSANNTSSLPGTYLCNQSQPGCTNNTNPHADAAHQYAIGTYQFYATRYLRDSIDNIGKTIISTVHYCASSLPCPYDNAHWSGTQMVYGGKYGFPLADDIVAHELTHGVTQYESDLFYYYQSGAINESFSDLWGEYYDQTNGLRNDTNGVKWLLGENVSGLGVLRSMSNPPAYGDPDKMSSTHYYESDGDNGGVHINSGVNNKAVYLMVEGGTFNGKTVSPLSWEKTGAIYYEVNTRLLTSGADYSDLYYVLQQACSILIGQKGITAGDCGEVRDALDAVEMNKQPATNFNTDAALCPEGMAVNTFFYDDFETQNSRWSFNDRWDYDSPYGPYAHSGNHFLYADDYPAYISTSVAQLYLSEIPYNAFLVFHHAYDFETYQTTSQSAYFDGGVLQYSFDPLSWHDAGPLMDYNGYRGPIYYNWNNPLKGRSAFVGSSHGYISTRLDLRSLGGKPLTLEWIMGLDDSGYSWGWWLDDVRVYTCGPEPIFVDVPNTHMFWRQIEAFYNAGLTTGCTPAGQTPRKYCPYANVTRAEMAVFLERAMGNFNPNPSPTGMFSDVPGTHWAAKFIDEYYNDGITTGCTSSPMRYCPDNHVTRQEMAVFIERALGNFDPTPNPTGIFADVPGDHWAARFINEFYNDGITTGCANNPLRFCPLNKVTRQEMAVFIVRAFNLPAP